MHVYSVYAHACATKVNQIYLKQLIACATKVNQIYLKKSVDCTRVRDGVPDSSAKGVGLWGLNKISLAQLHPNAHTWISVSERR